jgi:hypothetical protein
MRTRRTIMSSVFALVGIGGLAGATAKVPAASGTTANSSGATYPRTSAESSAGLIPALTFPPGDVRRYGLVANSPSAATENTRALTALVSPLGAFAGGIWFPNSSGKDIYYLDDIIPFHDGIQIDLQGCTLHFSKTGVRGDTNSGFIFAVRNFSIANGSIVVDYQMGGGGTSAGSALTFGNRGEDSRYFSPTYDSLLPSPMGNIVVRNLRIKSNTKGGTGIFMIGGLNGVVMENIWIDGSAGALENGMYYEFGWATNEPKMVMRQTSHAYNMRFTNINISNINTEHGSAIGFTGAYNCSIDGLYVKSAKSLFLCSPGESAFFRPWAGVDQIGAKRNIAVRNVVGVGIAGTAIAVAGASSKSGGYLRVTENTAIDQTDLVDCSIDGFAIDGANLDGGYGIQSSAEKIDLRNGRITNFRRGLVTTDECTRMTIEGVDIFGCKQCGMEIGQQSSIWNPPRQKMGFIRNCFIAGNSTATPGVFAAIELDRCATFFIEGNRFGYEAAHDGIPETTQGFAIRIGTRANNVVCRCNHTAGVRAGGTAFVNRSGSAAQGNTIENSSGNTSSAGAWDGLGVKR